MRKKKLPGQLLNNVHLTVIFSTLILSLIIFAVATKKVNLSSQDLSSINAVGAQAAALQIKSVTASSSDSNIPENTVDGDLNTRWSAYGDGQWIQYELNQLESVESIKIAFFAGNTRIQKFDIQTSSDGQTWSTVLTGESSGTTLNSQNFNIQPTSVKFIRIVGHGNFRNGALNSYWNSLNEVSLHKSGGVVEESGNGLLGSYYNGTSFSGTPQTRLDSQINFSWNRISTLNGINPNNFSIRWTGFLTVPASGTYTFYTVNDDGVRVFINNSTVINDWVNHAAKERKGTIALESNKRYPIKIEYFNGINRGVLQFLWSGPSLAKQIIPTIYLSPTTLTPLPSNNPSPTSVPVLTPRPSASATLGTPRPTVIPTLAPSPIVPPASLPPVVGAKKGLWISQAEIAALPMSGSAWTNMKSRADSNIGSANLADQNSNHDQNTLAVALVAARTGDVNYRNKAVSAILSAIGTDANRDPDCETSPSKARSLGLSRNLSSYILAADIINLRAGTDIGEGTRWAQYVQYIRFKKNCRNNGSVPEYNLSESHENGSSNGDALAGGARIAAAVYLNDTAEIEKAWQTYQRYSGDTTKCSWCRPNLNDNGISWSHTTDSSQQVAINPPGTTKNGQRIDGAIVNDQGRGGAFKWPPGYTAYPWEGMQGYIMQAEIFARAGYPSYNVMGRAPLRVLDYQYFLSQQFGSQWFNDEPWVTWVVNKAYGTNYPTVATNGGGKNMSWTDWTHTK
jgi:hypothetical protein